MLEPASSEVAAASIETRRKRPRRKGSPRPKKNAEGPKEKVNYYLSPDAVQRVGIAATMERKDKSEIIEELIQEHLRKWVVSCRDVKGDDASPDGNF